MHEKADQISEKVRPSDTFLKHLSLFYRYSVSSKEFYIEGKKELVQHIEKLTALEEKLQRKCDKFKQKTDSAIFSSDEILQRFQKLPKMGNQRSIIERSFDEDFDFFVQNSPVQRLVKIQ